MPSTNHNELTGVTKIPQEIFDENSLVTWEAISLWSNCYSFCSVKIVLDIITRKWITLPLNNDFKQNTYLIWVEKNIRYLHIEPVSFSITQPVNYWGKSWIIGRVFTTRRRDRKRMCWSQWHVSFFVRYKSSQVGWCISHGSGDKPKCPVNREVP